MITLNQTTGNNNGTIWVLKINTDTPIYLATRDLSLTNTYDGQVLNYENYLTELSYESSIKGSGGTGAVTSFGFSISRHISNTALDGFFNEFYPATSGVYLTSRIVQIGVCWVGASADTDITWLFAGRVISYDFEQREMNVLVFQESEITNKEIPYYSIQKDFDNDISYFVGAPDDSYGMTIPILYGDFTQGTTQEGVETGGQYYAPAICVGKRGHRYIVCSHKAFYTADVHALLGNQEYIFIYLENVNSYMWVKNETASDSSTDNYGTSYVINMKDRAGKLIGYLSVRLTELSALSDVDNVDNAIDNDITTYTELDAVGTGDAKLALRAIGSLSTSDVGFLGFTVDDIGVTFRVSSDSANARDVRTYYSNPNVSVPTGSNTDDSISGTSSLINHFHTFGNSTTAKIDASLPWRIDEVLSLDFVIMNRNTTPGEKIRVYGGFVDFYNIIVHNSVNIRATRNDGGRNY